MPQLDFLIILPQIFWLILFFTFFYFFLTYYFLPLFLRTILSRNKFFKQNSLLEFQLKNELFEKRQFFFKKLNLTFVKINSQLFYEFLNLRFSFVEKPFKQNVFQLNKKIFVIFKKSLFFCNPIILNYFKFYPAFLNKKKYNC